MSCMDIVGTLDGHTLRHPDKEGKQHVGFTETIDQADTAGNNRETPWGARRVARRVSRKTSQSPLELRISAPYDSFLAF